MNQRKLAELANVSQATISRVLNNHLNVSPDIRNRVLSIMEQHYYLPNALAQALVTKATKTLGLIVYDITNPFFIDFVRGVQDQARKNGFIVIILNTDGIPSEEESCIQTLLGKRVDGIILGTVRLSKRVINRLTSLNVPLVLINRELHSYPSDCVFSNHYDGASKAMKHLISHGYKRIVHIASPLGFIATSERMEAYFNVLKDNGIKPEHWWIQYGDLSLESGYQTMLRLLDYSPQLQAVFTANDMMAIGAMEAAFEKGLQVPQDVAFIGFDDIQLSSFKTISLTTVRQDRYLLGYSATDLLLTRIHALENRPNVRKVLPTELVIRRSCGCD